METQKADLLTWKYPNLKKGLLDDRIKIRKQTQQAYGSKSTDEMSRE
jgi:hypothetical protein